MFVIFFSIVFLVYFLVNYYIYTHGIKLLPQESGIRTWFTIAFWLIVSTYVLGRFIERVHLSAVTDVLTWIGSFWLAVMLYLFLIVLFVDIIRLANYFIHFIPPSLISQNFKTTLFTIGFGVAIITVAIGHINAVNPAVKKIVLDINKQANGLKEVKIALVSDIHMGTVIGPRRMTKLVKEIERINPDLVLLAGDIVDEDLQPVIRHDMGDVLKKLTAPMGVYAITGNHEYIGGVNEAVDYLEKHNISFLRDTSVKIADAFYIVGREDRSKTNRKSIASLLNGRDSVLPVIMLDHQPFDLDSVVTAGVDVQFSGHTHHGQLWPLNYITEAIFEVSRGYLKKGNTHFYVSNGYGSWGPPVRIGNRSEIVEVKLRFKE